jgi:predicted chitinase
MLDTLRGYGRRKMVAVLSRRRRDLVDALATRLAEQFPKAGIVTPVRQAHFIAQTSVETDFYNTMREYGDAARFKRLYEDNRTLAANLGNNQPGDGALFRGRGLIQLTGRSNYTRASAALGLGDRLVEQPQLVEHDLNIAISAALWYWTDKKINTVCERSGTVDAVALAVSRAVNRGNPDHTGQPNHRDDRRLATLAAYEAFAVATS